MFPSQKTSKKTEIVKITFEIFLEFSKSRSAEKQKAVIYACKTLLFLMKIEGWSLDLKKKNIKKSHSAEKF